MTIFELSVALVLAQTCVAEIGFQGTADECLVMWEVNKRVSALRGRSLLAQTKLYNAYWRSESQRRRRPYVERLGRSGDKPIGWPRKLRWDRYRDRWLLYVRSADLFVSGKTNELCPQAIDYGAPSEIPKMREKMRRINCLGGRTLQWYWALGGGN